MSGCSRFGEQALLAHVVTAAVGRDREDGGAGVEIGRPGRHRDRLAGAAGVHPRPLAGLDLLLELPGRDAEEVVLVDHEAQQLLQPRWRDPPSTAGRRSAGHRR